MWEGLGGGDGVGERGGGGSRGLSGVLDWVIEGVFDCLGH